MQRPAAIDQLIILGEQIGIPVYSEDSKDAVKVAKNSLKFAKDNNHDVVVLDTAGRLHIDKEMMVEISKLWRKNEMKLLLNEDIIGRNGEQERKHASRDDEVRVLVQHKSYYTCDSTYYLNTEMIVFPSQASIIEEYESLEEKEFDNELEYGILPEQTE